MELQLLEFWHTWEANIWDSGETRYLNLFTQNTWKQVLYVFRFDWSHSIFWKTVSNCYCHVTCRRFPIKSIFSKVFELTWVLSLSLIRAHVRMFKRTSTHVHHLLSMTIIVTWLQTCRILATLVPVVAWWSGPSAAFLPLTFFLASLGNQRSWATSNPLVERIPPFS